MRSQPTTRDKDVRANSKAARLAVCRLSHRAFRMPKKSAGMAATFRPSKSLIWDSMISTAMPLVKPITTATGMNRISVPKRNKPNKNSSTPDMAVAKIRLASP